MTLYFIRPFRMNASRTDRHVLHVEGTLLDIRVSSTNVYSVIFASIACLFYGLCERVDRKIILRPVKMRISLCFLLAFHLASRRQQAVATVFTTISTTTTTTSCFQKSLYLGTAAVRNEVELPVMG